jgi:hypothetical protein
MHRRARIFALRAVLRTGSIRRPERSQEARCPPDCNDAS